MEILKQNLGDIGDENKDFVMTHSVCNLTTLHLLIALKDNILIIAGIYETRNMCQLLSFICIILYVHNLSTQKSTESFISIPILRTKKRFGSVCKRQKA